VRAEGWLAESRTDDIGPAAAGAECDVVQVHELVSGSGELDRLDVDRAEAGALTAGDIDLETSRLEPALIMRCLVPLSVFAGFRFPPEVIVGRGALVRAAQPVLPRVLIAAAARR
jgi:hypothetical protein